MLQCTFANSIGIIMFRIVAFLLCVVPGLKFIYM